MLTLYRMHTSPGPRRRQLGKFVKASDRHILRKRRLLTCHQCPLKGVHSKCNRGGLGSERQFTDICVLGYGFTQIANQADIFVRNSNSNARTRQTFQSQKRAKGTSTWQLKQFADATLGGNSLRKCVQLPEGEDRSEWLAVNGMIFLVLSERSQTSDNSS